MRKYYLLNPRTEIGLCLNMMLWSFLAGSIISLLCGYLLEEMSPVDYWWRSVSTVPSTLKSAFIISVALALPILIVSAFKKDRSIALRIAVLFGFIFSVRFLFFTAGSFKKIGLYDRLFLWDLKLDYIDRIIWPFGEIWIHMHYFFKYVDPHFIFEYYLLDWQTVAKYTVLIALITGTTRQRFQFSLTALLCCVALSNIAAYVFASAGPVLYSYHAIENGLPVLPTYNYMLANGFEGSSLEGHMLRLWTARTGPFYAETSGISAFPSMHVAFATLTPLVLSRFGKVFSVVGWGYVLSILLLSVYTGFHYFSDGLFSIAVITAVWSISGKMFDRIPAPQNVETTQPSAPAKPSMITCLKVKKTAH